jgi:MerR family transcriptional regulator, light-induced transcriptional regulator
MDKVWTNWALSRGLSRGWLDNVWTRASPITNFTTMTSMDGGGAMLHPIGVVAMRTGLSPDVIRVWERRYGVVTPERDEAGRRLYTDADVELLTLLAEATAGGRGIGQVAVLQRPALEALVREDASARRLRGAAGTPGPDAGDWVELALELTRALDGARLEAELGRAAALLGLAEFLEGVVAPLFRRIGEEWHEGSLSVAQEHLASGVASALVSRLAATLGVGARGPVVVVATPVGEHHQIGALLAAAVASGAGWRVAYLGANVPAAEVARAAREAGARCVALSLVYGNGAGVRAEVEAVRAALPPGVALVVGGPGSPALDGVPGVLWLEDLESLRGFLTTS